MIKIDIHDSVAVLQLERGVTNALNQDLLAIFSDSLNRIKTDKRIRSMVLTSNNHKFFSIGLDIPYLFTQTREQFSRFYHKFNQLCFDLFTLPKVVIAAIPGHAIAGGCILTLCCDYRFISEGRKLMGLNEIKLGVPVPFLADCILNHLVEPCYSREILDFGEFYAPDELLKMGLVDRVLPQEELLEKAIIHAQALAGQAPEALQIIKQNRTEAIGSRFRQARQEKEELFVNLWYKPETREHLKEAMEKF